MAQAMGVIADAGTFHQTRLVKQVQSIDNTVVGAYPDRIMAELNISEENLDDLRKGLVMVTSHGTGTGRRAATVKNVKVAGKTGTAQWGPVSKKRNAAWFAGYAPADHPLYAFSVVVEGNPGESVAGGATAAPLIGEVLATLLKDYQPPVKEEEKAANSTDEETPTEDAPVETTEFTEDLMNPDSAAEGEPEAEPASTPAANP
jgi:penicillin-binding protein 2